MYIHMFMGTYLYTHMYSHRYIYLYVHLCMHMCTVTFTENQSWFKLLSCSSVAMVSRRARDDLSHWGCLHCCCSDCFYGCSLNPRFTTSNSSLLKMSSLVLC